MCNYKQNMTRDSTPRDVLQHAAVKVDNGQAVRVLPWNTISIE